MQNMKVYFCHLIFVVTAVVVPQKEAVAEGVRVMCKPSVRPTDLPRIRDEERTAVEYIRSKEGGSQILDSFFSPGGSNPPCGMSRPELAAIKFYSANGFRIINGDLRAYSRDPAAKALMRVLFRALVRIAPYRGVVHRGTVLPVPVRDALNTTGRIHDRGFISSSTERGVAQTFSGGGQLSQFEGESCRYIGGVSSHLGEREALCFPLATFRVISAKGGGRVDQPRPGENSPEVTSRSEYKMTLVEGPQNLEEFEREFDRSCVPALASPGGDVGGSR